MDWILFVIFQAESNQIRKGLLRIVDQSVQEAVVEADTAARRFPQQFVGAVLPILRRRYQTISIAQRAKVDYGASVKFTLIKVRISTGFPFRSVG